MEFNKKTKKIFETPIPFDELPTSGHLVGKDKPLMLKRAVTKEMDKIKKMLSDMSWKDINFRISSTTYTIILPEPIITYMKNFYNCQNQTITDPFIIKFRTEYDQLCKESFKANFCTGSYCFYGLPISSNYICMGIDSSQRTHFPNSGINDNLKNTGLGKKLYRALIEQKPWVTTNSGGSTIKDWMWASLSHEQFKADGSRDYDAEIYSFRFSSALYAVSTTRADKIEGGYEVLNKITPKSKLLTKASRMANNIGIDADFIEYCKTQVDTNRYAKLVVKWVNPTPAQLREAEAEAEAERVAKIEAERVANLSNAEQAKVRYNQYCGPNVNSERDFDYNWEIGDFIVLKDYLTDLTYISTPIRKVTRKEGNTFYAYKLSDRNTDSRNTTNKNSWVKCLPPAVGYDYPPGINNTPVTALRVDEPEVNPNRRATPETTPSTQNTTVDTTQNIFTGAEKENTLTFTNTVRKRFLRDRNIDDLIYVPTNLGSAYTYHNSCIFGFFRQGPILYNSKTMLQQRINDDLQIMLSNSVPYKMETLESKTQLSPGDLVFINMHARFFGYIAVVKNIRLTSRGDNYVNMYVLGAGANNVLTLTPRALDRLVRYNPENESITNIFKNLPKSINKYLKS